MNLTDGFQMLNIANLTVDLQKQIIIYFKVFNFISMLNVFMRHTTLNFYLITVTNDGI